MNNRRRNELYRILENAVRTVLLEEENPQDQAFAEKEAMVEEESTSPMIPPSGDAKHEKKKAKAIKKMQKRAGEPPEGKSPEDWETYKQSLADQMAAAGTNKKVGGLLVNMAFRQFSSGNSADQALAEAEQHFKQIDDEAHGGGGGDVAAGREKLKDSHANFTKPEDVIAWFNSLDDEEKLNVKAALRQGASDDIAPGSKGSVVVGNLFPTQNEVDAGKSLAFPLANAGAFIKTLLRGESTAPEISISGDYVLDGHHRWSSTLAVNPEAKINVYNINFPSDVPENNGAGYLAASQLMILSALPGTTPVPVSVTGKNAVNIISPQYAGNAAALFTELVNKGLGSGYWEEGPILHAGAGFMNELRAGADIGQIAEKIHPNIAGNTYGKLSVPADYDEFLAKVGGAQETEQIADAIARLGMSINEAQQPASEEDEFLGLSILAYCCENLANINQPKGDAPARDFMPQFDAPAVGGDAGRGRVLNRAAKGRVDINLPGEVSESIDRNEIKILSEHVLNRWTMLAGIKEKK